MRKTAIIAAMLLLGAARAGAQVDSCLVMALPNDSAHGTLWNPDSVMRDTCHDGYYLRYFVKAGIEVIFLDSGVVPLGYGAPDSILEVGWQAIDTNFSVIRAAFEHLYNHLGSFVLRKENPADTSTLSSGIFKLIFQAYTNVDSALADLDSLPDVKVNFYRPNVPAGIVLPALIETQQPSNVFLFPNPASGTVEIRGGELHDVLLFNESGQRISSWKLLNGTFDISGVPPGPYFLFSNEGSFHFIIR
jgi:hypothetical protein